MPFSTLTDLCELPRFNFVPLHDEHLAVITLPFPPQTSQCCCICWKNPGAIWCRTILTPCPLQALHFFTCSWLLAPEPRHVGQIICLLISISKVLPRNKSDNVTSRPSSTSWPLASRCWPNPAPPANLSQGWITERKYQMDCGIAGRCLLIPPLRIGRKSYASPRRSALHRHGQFLQTLLLLLCSSSCQDGTLWPDLGTSSWFHAIWASSTLSALLLTPRTL